MIELLYFTCTQCGKTFLWYLRARPSVKVKCQGQMSRSYLKLKKKGGFEGICFSKTHLIFEV